MYRPHGAAALLLLLGLTASAHGQAKDKPINSIGDALAVAKKDKKLVVISFENPK